MKKLIGFLSVLFSALALCGQTQQVIATSGGSGQAGETVMDWTLGEPVITTLTGGDDILTQGFHQPVLTVTAIKVSDNLPYTIDVYPNPTHDLLLIRLKDSDIQGFLYLLYDMNGKVLELKLFESDITAVNMDQYPAGLYLLKVMQQDTELKTFEIVKN